MSGGDDSERGPQPDSGREPSGEQSHRGEGDPEQGRSAEPSDAPDASEDAPSHEQLAHEMGARADDMQDRSSELQQDVKSTRSEWERRQADESVPGAVTDKADPTYGAKPSDGEGNADSDTGGPATGQGHRRDD